MPSIKPRNITPQLRRLTVSGQELASLGWLHGTVGRLRKGLGMGFAYQTGEFTIPSGRIDTASLRIEQQWPKELVKFAIAVLAAAAIITTLALAGANGPEPDPETSAAVIAPAPDALPEMPEPVPVIEEEEAPPSLVPPKKVKKTRKGQRNKKRRGKKKRRRR